MSTRELTWGHRAVESLLLTRCGRRRRRDAMLLAAGLLAAALWIGPRALANADRFPLDDHASASLDQAVNLARCRRTGVLSMAFNPSRQLKTHPEDLTIGMSELIAAHAGSVGRYCDTLTTRFTNNENALMLLMSGIWSVRPDWSADAVGRALLWIRVAAVGLFGFACLEAGMSVALGFAVMLGAVVVLGEVTRYQYTVYPFLLVIPLAWAALLSLAAGTLGRASLPVAVAFGGGSGIVAAFLANLRTSYWPLLVAAFALTIVTAARSGARRPGQGRRFAAVAFIGFFFGAAVFQAAVIGPIQRASGASAENYVYHTVALPLVVGLAVPPNDLSQRESIRWDDSSGAEIATRVVPGVRFLGPDYEAALYRYYFGLWRASPTEMLRTYRMKLTAAGQGIFLQSSELVPAWRPMRRVYLVWADRVNGLMLLLAAFGCTSLALWRSVRTESPTAHVAALLGATAVLLLAEAAVIYSTFFLAYHSFLMLLVLLAPAAAAQALVDAAHSLFSRGRA